MKHPHSRELGFSLIQMIVVVGVSSILFLAINQIVSNQNLSQSHITDSMTKQEIRNYIEENIDCAVTDISKHICNATGSIPLLGKNGKILVDNKPNPTTIDRWQVKASCLESVLVSVKPWRKKDPLKQTDQSNVWTPIITEKDRLCTIQALASSGFRVEKQPLKPIHNFAPKNECGSPKSIGGCQADSLGQLPSSCFRWINRTNPNKKMTFAGRVWEATAQCESDEAVVGGGAVCDPHIKLDPNSPECHSTNSCAWGGGWTISSSPDGNNGWRTRCCIWTFAGIGDVTPEDQQGNYSDVKGTAQAYCRKRGAGGDIE